MSLLPRQPIFRLLLAACAALAAEAVCPSEAAAGCGDYIVYTNPADAERHHRNMPADSPKPACHGPNCSQQPPLPAAPSSPTKARTIDDDRVGLTTSCTIPEPESHTFPRVLNSGPSVRRGSDIFHPPR